MADALAPVLFVLVALTVLGVVAVVAGGRGGELGAAGSDRPPPWLPEDRPLTGDDVDAVHFGVGFRGYRMDEVDVVLDRLADELRERGAGADRRDPSATSRPDSNLS